MIYSRFYFVLVLSVLLAEPAEAQTSKADTPDKIMSCAELIVLVNAGGRIATTDAEKQLFHDLRQWGEIAAMREDLRRARRWLTDPQYDPRGQSLLGTIVLTRFHADGKTWEDIHVDVVQLYDLFAMTVTDRSKVEAMCAKLQSRVREVQKPVYISLRAQLPPKDDDKLGNDERTFLESVQQQLQEMYDDSRAITMHERHLITSMRRFEGKRLSARRAAFWLAAYRAGEMK